MHSKQGTTIAIKVAPRGLGFGVGPISVKRRLEDANDLLDARVMTKVEKHIMHENILVPISSDDEGQLITDDGCGDGRGVNRVMRGSDRLNKSLNRAKVFGGGLTMGIAARIGLGRAKRRLKDEYTNEADEFKHRGIDYGAHIDEGFGERDSGCGAIDKAPQNIINANRYKNQIEQSIEAMAGYLSVSYSDIRPDLEEIFKNYQRYQKINTEEDHAGAKIIEVAAKDQKVVKELDNKDGHREVAIVLNLIPDMTVNQQLVRDDTSNIAQVFGVDIPRLIKIAKRRYEDDESRQAFLSMLIYTLSTAATLTDGTLPVYLIRSDS